MEPDIPLRSGCVFPPRSNTTHLLRLSARDLTSSFQLRFCVPHSGRFFLFTAHRYTQPQKTYKIFYFYEPICHCRAVKILLRVYWFNAVRRHWADGSDGAPIITTKDNPLCVRVLTGWLEMSEVWMGCLVDGVGWPKMTFVALTCAPVNLGEELTELNGWDAVVRITAVIFGDRCSWAAPDGLLLFDLL